MEEQSPSSGMLRTPSVFRRASAKTSTSKGGGGGSEASSPMRLDQGPAAISRAGPPTSYGAGGRYPSRKLHCAGTGKMGTAVAGGSRMGRSHRLRSATAAQARKAQLTGYLAMLPSEVMEMVVKPLGAADMASLELTCTYFLKTGITEAIAKGKLKDIPRARGLRPERKAKESNVLLLHFVNCQSQAAAQGTALAFGAYHSAALLIEGESRRDPATGADLEHSLYTFGRGFHGQLGLGNYDSLGRPNKLELSTDSGDPVMPAVVACGASHTGSISRRGELFTWGLASSGELGHGGWTPIEVNLPTQVLALSRTRIVSVTAGTNHTLAISEYGHLWTCGRGRHGQLGHGTFHDEGPLQRVDTLVGCRIVSAAAGAAHSMALASDGSLFTWGNGQYGQLGHKRMKAAADVAEGLPVASPEPEKVADLDPEHLKPPSRVTAIASGSNHSMALTVGGALLMFGRNKSGCLGLGDSNNRWVPTKAALGEGVDRVGGRQRSCSCRVVQVTAGSAHTLALVAMNGRLVVKTAGANVYGQLGLGDTLPRDKFDTVRALTGRSIVSVSSGNDHSGAVDSAGRLFLWGRGELGQLGLSDFRSRWTPQMLPGFCVVHPDRTLRRNRTASSSPSS